ncbi:MULTISPECIES: metal ABC transporter permease [Tatumella]|uniref:Metal ABC transporter permease n=1 Tax=Tatumella punctata TaxID=399969 RepID=A0ABW1VRC4_9GAMM|nr:MULTISPECIES: metal ABC transporter permease [unclassified Tatumella]MBS0856684.1 metal ABC transporter permease [Tatumella sp. JGM16]MBS0878023.1 metal ABC transporter permease [Tatumella sp. JGM82]MBS0891254.1 metal ABC transporter permease [Tatumella sp. JGM94]MBS0902633.1 metal ABC transporter permease [Tatumella sp. JGM100]MBS0912898.1 metal ABC transporter permease [Tatumella sp. JGM91]
MFSGFMFTSWIAASLVAIVCGLVGFFVILRGASFTAHALPMSAFPGAAAAVLLGVNPFYGVLLFSVLGALGIHTFGRHHHREVATALCLVTLLAIGTLLLSLSGRYVQSVYSLLFGDLLGISRSQLLPLAISALVAVLMIATLFRRLLLSSFSPELAAVRGIPLRNTELWFLAILALTTSIALPVVGSLLVFSLMIAPPAIARSLCSRPASALLLSVVISLTVVWSAIALSWLTDWPPGFFVGTLGALFCLMERGYSRFRETACSKDS